MAQQFYIQFRGQHEIYEEVIKCTAKESEFNLSYNPSLQSDPSGTLKSFSSASYFTPYVTTIGLYNSNNELLAVAKLGRAIPLSQNIDTNFIIRIDK